jgi:hypothetical protein
MGIAWARNRVSTIRAHAGLFMLLLLAAGLDKERSIRGGFKLQVQVNQNFDCFNSRAPMCRTDEVECQRPCDSGSFERPRRWHQNSRRRRERSAAALQWLFDAIVTFLPLVKSGKLRDMLARSCASTNHDRERI